MAISARMLLDTSPRTAAIMVLALAFATIAGAWIFEWAGYLPCELCLKQRWAYYTGVPLALAAAICAYAGPRWLAKALLVLLAVIFSASAVFGAYHAGVEWKFWPGPSGCTGGMQFGGDMGDFRKQLEGAAKLVRCDEVAIRILGLSLAGWNAVISSFLAAAAARGAFHDTARSA
ncbi:MAG: disulfide bond formation protein B [Beijerinckiaceae bacterium]